jgi:hypothetical protein
MTSPASFCEISDTRSLLESCRIVARALPDGDFKRILVKPNWVMHEENPNTRIAKHLGYRVRQDLRSGLLEQVKYVRALLEPAAYRGS